MADTETFYDRLLKERKELTEKIDKLTMFLTTQKFEALHGTDQRLLVEQHAHMLNYRGVLCERIDRLEQAQSLTGQ